MTSDPITDDPNIERQIQAALAGSRGKPNQAKMRVYLDSRALTEEPNTVLIDARDLRDFTRAIRGRSIASCKLKDIHAFVSKMKCRGVRNSRGTQGRKLTTLRTFHRWLHKTDFPGDWRQVKIPYADWVPLDPSVLITEEDYGIFLETCRDRYEKAWTGTRYEAGFRSSEVAALRLDCIQDAASKKLLSAMLKPGQGFPSEAGKEGFYLLLPKKDSDGRKQRGLKTGVRRVLIVKSAPLLAAYLAEHPSIVKPNLRAPIWQSRVKGAAPMAHMSKDDQSKICDRFETALRKRGISKHIYPHLFRHSAATNKARLGWSPSQLNTYFGWSPFSKTAARYIHLSDTDVDDRVRQDHGLHAPKPTAPTAQYRCKVCRFDNIQPSRYCSDCGSTMDATLSSKQEQQTAGLAEELLRAIEETIRFVRMRRSMESAAS